MGQACWPQRRSEQLLPQRRLLWQWKMEVVMPSTGNWYASDNYDPDPNLKIWMGGKLVPVADARVSFP